MYHVNCVLDGLGREGYLVQGHLLAHVVLQLVVVHLALLQHHQATLLVHLAGRPFALLRFLQQLLCLVVQPGYRL